MFVARIGCMTSPIYHSLFIFQEYLQSRYSVDYYYYLLHHPLLYQAVLVIDSTPPILLSWFVCQRSIILVNDSYDF